MAQVGIDFSAIAVEHFEFKTKSKKVYTLNDDLPLDAVVQILAVRERYQRLLQRANEPDMTSDDAQPLIDDWTEGVISAALDIFRNTPEYAQVTEEELLADFDVIHLWAIVGFFSIRLFEKSSQQQNATTAAEASPSNRKTRRATAVASRSV